ncbi:MAG: Crp/Fnr family transcriptional regulator [Chloroflexi bacterium]|nr:Crp/Fnr family transcriptional regulator [Chloroflexota bacterium]MBU1748005.1 Crp/Fnr family transcriptional regulator [Chloroflexota bacterium]
MTEIDWLTALPTSARDQLRATARVAHLTADESLFHEGDRPTAVYIVVAGQVKRVKHSDVGKDIILEVVGPGAMLGEMAVLARQPHDTSAQTLDEVTVWRVEADDWRRLVARYPALGQVVIAALSRRLSEAQDTIRGLTVDRVERRIARTLLKLAKTVGHREGRTFVLDLPLTRQDIAEMTGTTVETVIRVMSKWRRDNMVDTIDNHIVLQDPHRLIAISEEL